MANSITNPVDTFVPTEFFANDAEIRTASRNLKAGENVVRGELLMSEAGGLLVAHDGTVGAAPMLAVYAVDASSEQKTIQVYTSAAVFADKITWPAAATTDDLKAQLLEGSGLTTYFSTGGY